MALSLVPPLKIPSTCKGCGETLTRGEMENWIRVCELHGRDPMEAAQREPAGIFCWLCAVARAGDLAASRNEDAQRLLKRISVGIKPVTNLEPKKRYQT